MKRLQILVVVTSFVAIFPLCLLGQDSPEDYVVIHNAARAIVGVEPLLWDHELESYANAFLNEHIEDCLEGTYLPPPTDMYGQNIARNRGSEYFAGVDAVAGWVAQKQNYDYETNSCIGGDPDNCLNYTQVVNKATTYLGCARAKCNNGATLVTCYYDPPGNIGDERPY